MSHGRRTIMGADISDLDKVFTFWLLRFKGKSISELETMCGECNGDLDKMFDLMLKNIPIRKTREVALFGLLVDENDELLKKKCVLIAYKASRDIVALGVFKKDYDGLIRYYDFCILNEYVNIHFKKGEDGAPHYVFKIVCDGFLAPELVVDLLPLFIIDICNLHSAYKNKEKSEQIISSIREKALIEYGMSLHGQKNTSTNKEEASPPYGGLNDPAHDVDREDVQEIKRRICAGEVGLLEGLLKIEDNAFAYKAIAEIYGSKVDGIGRNFEKTIEYYGKAAKLFKEASKQWQYANCMNQIAAIYCDKDNPNASNEEAIKWFHLGSYASSEHYIQHMACSYSLGYYEASFKSAVRAVELRDARGFYHLGRLFSDEEIDSKIDYLETNYQLAARCFEESQKASSLRHKSMKKLALLLVNNKISVYDSPMALDALIELSESDGGIWSVRMAEAYYLPRYGLDKDYEKADLLFNACLDHVLHNTRATLLFGELILCGLSKLDKRHVKELMDGIEKNHPDREVIWIYKGIYLYHGLGYDVDKRGAYEYFSKGLSYRPADVVCLSYIAVLNMEGFGERRNAHEAFDRLVYLSASDDYCGARSFTFYLIAECYFHGIGTDVDYAKAMEYYEKASSYQSMRIFCIFSKIIDCMNRLGIDNKERTVAVAMKSRYSSDAKAEEIAGDLLLDTDEALAMEYYRESSQNGNNSARVKYQRLLDKKPIKLDEREELVEKKITALCNTKLILNSKYGLDNISSKRCDRLIALLSGSMSVEELDDFERVIFRDNPLRSQNL